MKDFRAQFRKLVEAELPKDSRIVMPRGDEGLMRPGLQMPSIAVLPFTNLSTAAENDYFCEGLAEELISALTRIKGVFVVARASAFSFRGKDADVREIGRQLNVDSILEGSVQKAGYRPESAASVSKTMPGCLCRLVTVSCFPEKETTCSA